jgi:outer membrane receptor protein involved in Fe transport
MFPAQSRIRSFRASAMLALFSCGASVADEAIDEIIVSADFRERAALEIPSSVTVLDRSTIEYAAVQHFEELIGIVPNLNWSGDGNRARYLQIRGVGELEQYEGAPNPSVGFIIDDIDFSGIGSVATLFDIQQIEILRGAQGSRYGANALAGLIYVHSVEPDDTFSGTVRLGSGNDGMWSGGIALGGPLGADTSMKYRLSAHRYRSDGFRRNAFLQRDDTNGRDETTLRGKLIWESANDWAIRISALFADIDDGYDAFAIDNSLVMLSDKPGRDAQQSLGVSLKAAWSGSDRFQFTSLTSAARSAMVFSYDADWGNDDAWAPIVYDYFSASDRDRRTLSQEFRLSSAADGRLFGDTTDWLVGVYTLRLQDDLDTRAVGVYDDGLFADSLDTRYLGRFDALNTALFGQLESQIGDAGRLGFGLRVEKRSTDYSDSAGLLLGPGETMMGGELSYRYLFSDSLLGFVTVSKGYKAGGFNLGDVPDESRRQYGRELLWNLEAGFKSSLHDGSLMFGSSVFFSRRIDQQVRTSMQLVPNDPASFVYFTDNAAQGRTLGLEADVRWLPTENWEFYASLGLLNAEFTDFLTLQTGQTELSNLAGRAEPHAPGYTAAAGGTWRHPSGWFVRLDASARDGFYFDVSNNQKSSAYKLMNARVGFEAERWDLQLWMRNVFDQRYAVRGFFFGNEPPLFPNRLYTRPGDPRQLGITFDVKF